MEFKDYYDILGVKPDDDKKVIKTAYRRLARKYHPDVSKEPDAEAKFKDISEAFEVLGNKEKRAEYDQLRQYGAKGQAFTPPPEWQQRQANHGFSDGQFSDFFENLFGAGFDQARGNNAGFSGRSQQTFNARGQDVETDLPLFLEDTLRDEAKSVDFSMPQVDQTGQVKYQRKSLKVKIPPGSIDGDRIRLKGQGGPGTGDAPAGDLYLRIKFVPHPIFDVSGHDLSLTLPLAPWEAALGVKLPVSTLDGKVTVTIAANSQTGQRLRLKGKGLKGKDQQGDLYVVLKIVMPTTMTDEAKSLWQQMADSSDFDPRATQNRQARN